MPVFHTFYKTETAGTALTQVIPPHGNWVPQVNAALFNVDGDADELTIMVTVAKTQSDSYTASGDPSITVENPAVMRDSSGAWETIATGDWIIFRGQSGTYYARDVTGVTGRVLSISSAISEAVDMYSPVYVMGEPTRSVHKLFKLKNIGRVEYPHLQARGGITRAMDRYNVRSGRNDPILIYVENTVADVEILWVNGEYVRA